MPKALAFDTFGTVVDWRSSIIAELEAFGETHGVQHDWPALTDRWRKGYLPAMDRVRRGELGWTKIDDLHRMILDELLLEAGIRVGDSVRPDIQAFFNIRQTVHKIRLIERDRAGARSLHRITQEPARLGRAAAARLRG